MIWSEDVMRILLVLDSADDNQPIGYKIILLPTDPYNLYDDISELESMLLELDLVKEYLEYGREKNAEWCDVFIMDIETCEMDTDNGPDIRLEI